MALNVCGSTVGTLCHVTLLVPTYLMLVMDFWKICACMAERVSVDNLAASDGWPIITKHLLEKVLP